MRNLFTVAALALGVAACSAQTNTEDFLPIDISVRLGLNLAIDSDLRDISSTLLGAGIEYRLGRPLLSSGETYFALDVMKGSVSGERGYIIPLTLNHRFFTRELGDGRRTYGFVGLGAAWLNDGGYKAVLAGRAGVGAELGQRIFVEGAVTVTDQGRSFSGNTVGLYVGYRF